MRIEANWEEQNRRLDSIDGWGLWRLAFWLAYAIASIAFLASWVVGMAPHDLFRPDFSPDYSFRVCVIGFAVVSILIARWVWKIKRPIGVTVVLWTAWGELLISLAGIIDLAATQAMHR